MKMAWKDRASWEADAALIVEHGVCVGKRLVDAVCSETRWPDAVRDEFLAKLLVRDEPAIEAPNAAVASILSYKWPSKNWFECADFFCQGVDPAHVAADRELSHVEPLRFVYNVHYRDAPERALVEGGTDDPYAAIEREILLGHFPRSPGRTCGPAAVTFSTPDAIPPTLDPDALCSALGLVAPAPGPGGNDRLVQFRFRAAGCRDVKIPTVLDARGHWAFCPSPAGSPCGQAKHPRTGVPGLGEVVHRGISGDEPSLGVELLPGRVRHEWWAR